MDDWTRRILVDDRIRERLAEAAGKAPGCADFAARAPMRVPAFGLPEGGALMFRPTAALAGGEREINREMRAGMNGRDARSDRGAASVSFSGHGPTSRAVGAVAGLTAFALLSTTMTFSLGPRGEPIGESARLPIGSPAGPSAQAPGMLSVTPDPAPAGPKEDVTQPPSPVPPGPSPSTRRRPGRYHPCPVGRYVGTIVEARYRIPCELWTGPRLQEA